ncbi:hypothetical protein [Bradyrhizobium vignae]|uniref:hypothetical protein n=1 Tax=Bradyrhizobium vignae TaxID=1549949 RepID=UPI00100B311B|nr:hypothetical protein [Bradyrhizobium vignae]RXG91882.1 hypothetical protein EAV90_27625 [Bradyrhizobium vignae]
MNRSGGYEREWRKLPHNVGVDGSRCRPQAGAQLSRYRLNGWPRATIDAEMIGWFAATSGEASSQRQDTAHEELLALVKARIALVELKIRLQS